MEMLRRKIIRCAVAAVVCTFVFTASNVKAQSDLLPSWNDTASKKAIVAFVEKVTKPGSPTFVPVAERIATFDNDGTLWAEQPMYFQMFFALDRLKALAPKHPEWKTREPFASLLKGDVKAAIASGSYTLDELVMATHAGMTTEEFEQIVKDWVATARHPVTGRLYTEMVYQPMLELLAYLRANGFKTFIVSGGGIDFMRPWTQKVYGIPPEQVVGSSIKTKFELRNGKPVLVRLPEVDFIDDKAGKPVGINNHIGRRPVAAFGNSDGDLQMLQWTAAGNGPRFCLYVHHTDAKREWAYDRQSPIGRLDKGLNEARAKGWTVVSMKDDWKRIFAFESAEQPGLTPTPAVPNAEFQKLNGRWCRPDGGYIIDVKNVSDNGQMEVSYYNPKSIHVSKALASRNETMTKVFIELHDVNYPGSTYTLTYDPQSDQLQGIYYQAALQQSFEVYFTRVR
jgi:hypothetical protein